MIKKKEIVLHYIQSRGQRSLHMTLIVVVISASFRPLGHFDELNIFLRFCLSSVSLTRAAMLITVYSAMYVSHVLLVFLILFAPSPKPCIISCASEPDLLVVHGQSIEVCVKDLSIYYVYLLPFLSPHISDNLVTTVCIYYSFVGIVSFQVVSTDCTEYRENTQHQRRKDDVGMVR